MNLLCQFRANSTNLKFQKYSFNCKFHVLEIDVTIIKSPIKWLNQWTSFGLRLNGFARNMHEKSHFSWISKNSQLFNKQPWFHLHRTSEKRNESEKYYSSKQCLWPQKRSHQLIRIVWPHGNYCKKNIFKVINPPFYSMLVYLGKPAHYFI